MPVAMLVVMVVVILVVVVFSCMLSCLLSCFFSCLLSCMFLIVVAMVVLVTMHVAIRVASYLTQRCCADKQAHLQSKPKIDLVHSVLTIILSVLSLHLDQVHCVPLKPPWPVQLLPAHDKRHQGDTRSVVDRARSSVAKAAGKNEDQNLDVFESEFGLIQGRWLG